MPVPEKFVCVRLCTLIYISVNYLAMCVCLVYRSQAVVVSCIYVCGISASKRCHLKVNDVI
jgi:hypothetical protein